jgi:hypothetical protein
VIPTHHSSYAEGISRRIPVQASQDKNAKVTKAKKAGDISQVVECLSTQSLNISTKKKNLLSLSYIYF